MSSAIAFASSAAASQSGGGSPLSVTADNATGSAPFVPGTATTSSGPNTVASGGAGPYTYAWTYRSGDADITISSATEQNPTWSRFFDDVGVANAIWRVTVTDALAATAFIDIDVPLTGG